MVTEQQKNPTTTDTDSVTVLPLETPDNDIVYCLSFLAPILVSTINKLYELNKPGWGSYCELFFETINDVMVAAHEESST